LLSHALSGCDTTSGLFGVGKTKVFKSDVLKSANAMVFYNPEASKSQIIEAGESLIATLYLKSAKETTLDQLRYHLYKKKLAQNSKTLKKVDPRRLPPTSEAASHHSLRVYHQVQEWKNNMLPPTDFGWIMSHNQLKTIKRIKDVAPQNILKVIQCGCTGKCTGKCSCKKLNLDCTHICGCGDDCQNREMLMYMNHLMSQNMTQRMVVNVKLFYIILIWGEGVQL